MTACIYFSPLNVEGNPEAGEMPAIVADTMVTFTGVRAPAVLPSNVTAASAHETSRSRLCRKSYVVGDRIAVAFAGEGKPIIDCLGEVAAQSGAWAFAERPMRRLGDLVNEYKGEVECIGAHVGLRPTQTFNSMVRGPHFDMGRMGTRVGAIGSGEKGLLELCKMLADSPSSVVPRTAFGDVITFWMNANAMRLSADLDPNTPTDWGGYLELLYYHTGEQRWKRGPAAIHMFVLLHLEDNETAKARLIPRMVAYDPEFRGGCLLSVAHGLEDADVCIFELDDLMEPAAPVPADPNDIGHWVDWRAQTGTVTVIYSDRGAGHQFSTRVLSPASMKDITFDLSDGKVAFGVAPEFLRQIVEGGIKQFGLAAKLAM